MNDRPTFGMRNDKTDLSTTSASLGDHLQQATDAAMRGPRVGTPVPKTLNGVDQFAGEEEVYDRVKHVLKRGDQLGNFYARYGLGKSQVLKMSKSEITRFVEIANQNAIDEPPISYERPPTPTRIVVDTW